MDNKKSENYEKSENINAKETLDEILTASKEKNIDLLRNSIYALQDLIDPQRMCSRPRESELEEFMKSGEICLYVGTGSAGSRIFININEKTLEMPVDEDDLRHGYGKRVQDNFRKAFDIPKEKGLLIDFKEIGV